MKGSQQRDSSKKNSMHAQSKKNSKQFKPGFASRANPMTMASAANAAAGGSFISRSKSKSNLTKLSINSRNTSNSFLGQPGKTEFNPNRMKQALLA